MRLWTIHPRYLDSKGLVALWREGLLAQAVLGGNTVGYRHHPQLKRFQRQSSPLDSIAAYLMEVQKEAQCRAYRFDVEKILSTSSCERITETEGQLQYEWQHLKNKLRVRAPELIERFCDVGRPEPHPIFHIVKGSVRNWERVKP